jgi:hypothetical protein
MVEARRWRDRVASLSRARIFDFGGLFAPALHLRALLHQQSVDEEADDEIGEDDEDPD